MIVFILIPIIIIVDQVIKFVVRSSLSPNQSVQVIGDLFRISYFRNEGAAFSSLVGYRGFLIGFAVLSVIAATVFLLMYKGRSKLLDWSLALIIAGGIGNLIDRIFLGYVTDMFSFSFFPPIFNFADIAITLGCALMILFVIFGKSEDLS